MRKVVCLILVVLLAALPVSATEFDDIMEQLDETGTYDVQLDDYEWTEADTDDVNSPYYLGEEADATETVADDLFEFSATDSESEIEYSDDVLGLLQKQIDVSYSLGVMLGIIAGMLFIKILFDRIRVV